jgi:hypothetical protein
MTSEASIPEQPNVFIYNKDTTKDDIPNDVTRVKVDPSVIEIHNEAFKGCESLVEVEFSEGLEVIFKEAFYNCKNLKFKNKLPSTLEAIDGYAFWGCASLDSIEFPEGLQVIGRQAFAECHELKRIKIASAHVKIEKWAFSSCKSLVAVDLPEGLQVIGESWFFECTSLTTVNVPSSVIEIQDGAFQQCASLASLALPEGLQSIAIRSFQGCESLESLHIPSTVCKTGRGVFEDCAGLRSITLPDALETIEDGMFRNCDSLTHVKIPSKVTKIGEGAFECCEGLKNLRIPSSVVEIERWAFQGCRQLTSVHLLGNSLHTIEAKTFYGCSSLTHVRIPSSVIRIESGVFAYCARLISLELPEGLEMIDGDPRYYDYADPRNIFRCQSLVNLVIPLDSRYPELDDDDGDDDEIMQGLKLRHVASNFEDLVSELQYRFEDLPVHRMCYYQSYYSLIEAMEKLRQSMDADPAAGNKVDSFGMTPLHILALSQTPILSLLQEVMKAYKVDIIRTRDKSGSTPIDYLCMNHTPASAMVIQSLLQTIFAERVRWLGLVGWKSDMMAAMDEALATDWSSRSREIGLLYFKLATYERLESVSLLELALWKVKIDSCKPGYETDHRRDEASSHPKSPRFDKAHLDGVDRESCRINSGANVVISNVLPFLDKVCREDYIAPEPSFCREDDYIGDY